MADGKRIVEEWQREWRGSAAPTFQSLARRIDALVAQRVREEREACAKIVDVLDDFTVTAPTFRRDVRNLAAAIRRRGEER